MSQTLKLACALAIGLVGGTMLALYLSPMSVFAQTLAPTNRVELMTGLGTKLGYFDPTQGTIRLVPIVKLQIQKTDRTVTLELSPEGNSR
jgi:hypothetical protein